MMEGPKANLLIKEVKILYTFNNNYLGDNFTH